MKPQEVTHVWPTVSDAMVEACRQIKAGIDAAREAGVKVDYPAHVYINGYSHYVEWEKI